MKLGGEGEQAGTGVRSGKNPYRHKEAHYCLPSENEWLKAAYHQNNGATEDYWIYPTGEFVPGSSDVPTAVPSGTDPSTAVYGQAFGTGPADITDAGGLSPYGTMGQGGNVNEWTESATDGNNSPTANRVVRGGQWNWPADSMNWGSRPTTNGSPNYENPGFGFRVASVPGSPASTSGVNRR